MNPTLHISLVPLTHEDREQFISDNQEAFLYGATKEFGLRDNHYEEEGQIISRKTIEASIDAEHAETYRIMLDGEKVGGVVINVDGSHGHLDLLFVSPAVHSYGIGYSTWCAIERLHPEVTVWGTMTLYFEKRNIHFYVNRCGFHIVEFFHRGHPDPTFPYKDDDDHDGMFRFEKVIKDR